MALRQEVAAVTDHGGSLGAAHALFPHAPQPWIDLSTGINPHAYPQLDLPVTAFTRLPEPGRIAELCRVAATAYAAPLAANVVAAPGTQILLPKIAGLVPCGQALVLGPTYAEHLRAVRLAGHDCAYAVTFDRLYDADVAILVNPNNPDGRAIERDRLLDLAVHLSRKGGLLVVDEAFMDVGPRDESMAGDVEACGAIVLRSFGKFFGLAGVRLGFALAPAALAAALNAELGPWAISGPALEYGLAGLRDAAWQNTMRGRLAREAADLDRLLSAAGLPPSGGTSLFRYLETPHAELVFGALGAAGILVRRFADIPHALRFGLPGSGELQRLRQAISLLPIPTLQAANTRSRA